jgi:hypothetical protein
MQLIQGPSSWLLFVAAPYEMAKSDEQSIVLHRSLDYVRLNPEL